LIQAVAFADRDLTYSSVARPSSMTRYSGLAKPATDATSR
jgi:hypothetical protein